MPGPAPKPADQRRRRNAPTANTLKLPKAGRQGPPPKFPLGKLSAADAKVWAELWSTPAAAAWELNSWTRVVARYLRVMRAADDALAAREPSAPLLAEVRQLEDRLGLTPIAMLRLRWEIDDSDELAEARYAHKGAASSSSRQRLRAVDPDAVARG